MARWPESRGIAAIVRKDKAGLGGWTETSVDEAFGHLAIFGQVESLILLSILLTSLFPSHSASILIPFSQWAWGHSRSLPGDRSQSRAFLLLV